MVRGAPTLSRRVLLLIGFSVISLLSYAFGVPEGGFENLQYFDESNIRVLPFRLPERKYLVIIVGSLVFGDLVRGGRLAKVRPAALRLYVAFLFLMGVSFVFDQGEALSYNVGALLMVVFLFYMYTFSTEELRAVLGATAICLLALLLLRNYFFPPLMDLMFSRRYGGGVNPNNHALYASLCLLLSFLFVDRGLGRWVVFFPMVLVAGGNVLLAGSRTSYLGLTFALLAFVGVVRGARALTTTIIALGSMGAVGLGLLSAGDVERAITRTESLDFRTRGTFLVPLLAFLDNMMIPYGLSAAEIVQRRYSSTLDSGYMWILLSGGVLALGTFFAFCFSAFRCMAECRKNMHAMERREIVFLGVCIGVLAYSFVFMIFEGGLRHILGWGDFVFLGCIVGLYAVRRDVMRPHPSVGFWR